MDKKVDAILKLYEYEKGIRSKSDPLRWEAMSFVGHRTKTLSCADDSPIKDRRLYSEAGKDAINTLASGFMSALMSENQEWFSARLAQRDYRIGSDPADNLAYSSYVTKSMLSEFRNSNFYSETGLASLDSIIGGYSCELVQNNDEENISYYQTLAPWRCWFDKDMKGNWDTFFYKYSLTGREFIERFGDYDIDERTMQKAVKGLNAVVFNMLYVICDRRKVLNEKTGSRIFKKGMKFAVLHIDMESSSIVVEEGTNNFPVVIHLWENSVDSHYGVGLVMKYISAFRRLNELAYEDGIVGEKNAFPPMNVPKIMEDSFSDDPKARNYYTTTDQLASQLDQRIDLGASAERLAMQEMTIRKLCYNDYFNWLSTHEQVYTATQVVQVKSEALSQLVPIYGNINSQKISKLLQLTFMNMIENDRLSKPEDGSLDMLDRKDANGKTLLDRDGNPMRMSKSRLSFSLESAMARQLETYTKSNALSYIIEMATAIINIGKQDVLDNFNLDNAIRDVAIGNGATPGMIITKQDVDRIRAERQRIASDQMNLENELKKSEIARNKAGASNLNNSMGFNGGMQ